MTPRALTYLSLPLLATLAAGCGMHDPYNDKRPPAATRTAPVVSIPPQRPPAPSTSTAAAILYRFARRYGEISATDVGQRERALAALATGPLARQLQASRRTARLLAIRAMPRRAEMTDTVISAQVAPPRGGQERGVAILQQRLETATGVIGEPVTDVFLATLRKTREGWRLTSFELQR